MALFLALKRQALCLCPFGALPALRAGFVPFRSNFAQNCYCDRTAARLSQISPIRRAISSQS
jgi:hypothetical protein